MKSFHILVMHGPNLNLLGTREPETYGHETLQDIDANMQGLAQAQSAIVDSFQSNHEGALVDRIHQAQREGVDGIIINPAAYTHTSVALRDALLAVQIPFVEVHLSNVHSREAFRQTSYLSDVALGVVAGFGAQSYALAWHGLMNKLGHAPK